MLVQTVYHDKNRFMSRLSHLNIDDQHSVGSYYVSSHWSRFLAAHQFSYGSSIDMDKLYRRECFLLSVSVLGWYNILAMSILPIGYIFQFCDRFTFALDSICYRCPLCYSTSPDGGGRKPKHSFCRLCIWNGLSVLASFVVGQLILFLMLTLCVSCRHTTYFHCRLTVLL